MKSRRIERKNARKEKKMKKHLFLINKSKQFEEKCQPIDEPIVEPIDDNLNKSFVKSNKIKNKTKNKSKIKSKINAKHMRDMKRDEKEIKVLEKRLKFNRKKKNGKKVTTLPKSFTADGLDYILDFINDNNEHNSDEEIADEDQTNDLDIHSEDDDIKDEEMDSIESDDDIDGEVEKKDNELKEDIYGFIRDGSGNIVKESHKTMDPLNTIARPIDQQLLRRIRGQLNRLTINNVLSISSQIQDMFNQMSRHDVNEALLDCINRSLIDLNHNSSQKLSTEISVLISILHTLVGEEVGGHAIHWLISKFNEFMETQTEDNKRIDNLVLLLINLNVCGLIESSLIYEILLKLCQKFNEKSIELIDLILKSIGFSLRKESAIKMKELVLRIQTEAKNFDENNLSGNRIKFLLASLLAIKNNNKNKLKGYGSVVDFKLIETTLKSTVKKPRVNGISGTYDAILQSSHWYSFTQNIEPIISDNKRTNDFKSSNPSDDRLNERLFKTLRLNTPLRKSIVMTLSTCDDYIDASHRLISLTKKQFSEVINVLIHICLHERHFNAFYSHLFKHLSQCDRKYRIALDFAIRDKIKELQSMAPNEQLVLSELVLQLLKLNALAITCLKVVHFTDMNETYVCFIKRILSPVLEDEQLIKQVLSKIPNKDSFATAIRLFINCFIDSKQKNKFSFE